ncbi:MAG: cytochrome c nitrite reductase small subunit [Propionibacteriaceae bacterium]|jgi:cytochrome c nitrite reductase small subunit|nr:cytochrome c nitrite reductase small subunit [Propionibacteriaceae bacterium]
MANGARRGVAGTVARLLAAFCLGTAAGVAGFTLYYADAAAYLGSDPATCTNCHVMQPVYDAWTHGPHARVATCNDCHLPHDNIVHKYYVKAEDGFLHVSKFTLGLYPENIRIRQSSLAVTNQACLSCHADLTDSMFQAMGAGEEITCTRCHSTVGHDQ